MNVKTRKPLLAVAALALALAMPAPAVAAFHRWGMTELYSNADGTVQFLELWSPANGEGFLSGHRLKSTAGGTTRTFTFPNDLPSQTGGKRMLVATEGFAALGVVTPDFVVPNGFFSPSGGEVNFADVDLWFHPALPSGGLALQRDGPAAANSPTNFVGQTGSITSVEAPNFQGLWWKAPAGTESGWGINFTHQGNTLFGTLFTYDANRTPLWLVMSDGVLQPDGSFTGDLYRTTGQAFNANPFTPIGAANVSKVGTMSVSFVDVNAGTLRYTVNGVEVTKAIQRQVYGSRAATCTTTTGSRASLTNYQDLWWNAAESGWGVNVTHQDNTLFATLFTYDASGRDLWLVMSSGSRQPDGSYLGELYRTSGPPFNANPFTPINAGNIAVVGNMRLRFTDGATGTLTYTYNGAAVTKQITRQVFSSPVPACS